MKIYIDFSKQAITKIDSDVTYVGDVYSNVFELLFFNFGDNADWFPTMSQLAPNGREAGDFSADALEENETYDYVENDITYKRYTFTIGDGWVRMKGRSNFFIWVNKLVDTNALQRKCYGKVMVALNESTDNYFVQDPYFNPNVKAYIDDVIEADMEEYGETVNASIEAQNEAIDNLLDGTPKVIATSTTILALTSNQGVAVATDNGYVYVWNGTGYYKTSIIYQATAIADGGVTWSKIADDVANFGFNNAISLLPFVQSTLMSSTESQPIGDVKWEEDFNRATINEIMHIENDAFILNSSTAYGFNIYYYDSNGNYSSKSGFIYPTTKTKINGGSYFRIIFRHINTTTYNDLTIPVADIVDNYSLYISNKDYEVWKQKYDVNLVLKQCELDFALKQKSYNLKDVLIFDKYTVIDGTGVGCNYGSNLALSQRNIFYAFTDLTIKVDYSTFRNNVFYYDSEGNYVSRTQNQSKRLIIPKGSYFKIMFKKVNDATFSSSDYTTLLNGLYLETFAFSKIMDITAPTANPSVTQQSCSTDGNNIFVAYPSDAGTYVGVLQTYNKGGLLLKTINNLSINHASQCAYYNGYAYIVGTKTKSTVLTVVKVNLADGSFTSHNITMEYNMVWDGFAIYGGFGYAIGFDNTAHVTTQQPTIAKIAVIDLTTLTAIKTIECNLPATHTHYTTQGMAVYGLYAFVITSSANSSQQFLNGMNIDIYNLISGEVNSIIYSSDDFSEPEGCFVLDGYVCTSLVNKGGIYRIFRLSDLVDEA